MGSTQKSETGQVGGSVGTTYQGRGKGSRDGIKGKEGEERWARWAPQPMEVKGEGKEREVEKEEEEGYKVVRGRWALPPMEGMGPREGQRMVIGQLVPPAPHENNTPWRHAPPPPHHAGPPNPHRL